MSFILRGRDVLTGKFAKLIDVLMLAKQAKIEVASAAPYTEYVIKGTRPHMIYPVNAQALANESTGFGPVAQAMHPGTKPNDFVTRAVDKARPLLIREYKSMIGEGMVSGAVRAEAARIKVRDTLIEAVRAEAPRDTGNLAKGIGLVGQIGEML
ncbi:MAG TPA: hypothetical protein VIG47_15560 [Gemmatimonadaceae bacterium]|jgi:hypothetical protein